MAENIRLDPKTEELLMGTYSLKGELIGPDLLNFCLDPLPEESELRAVIFTGPPGVGKTIKSRQLRHALVRISREQKISLAISEVPHDDLLEEISRRDPPVIRNTPLFNTLYAAKFDHPEKYEVVNKVQGKPLLEIRIGEIPGIKASEDVDRGEESLELIFSKFGRRLLIVDSTPDLFAQERALSTREIVSHYPMNKTMMSLMRDAKVILEAEDTTDSLELVTRARKEVAWMAPEEKILEIRTGMYDEARRFWDEDQDKALGYMHQIIMPPGYDPDTMLELLRVESQRPGGPYVDNVLASRLVTLQPFWRENFGWGIEDTKLLAAQRQYTFLEKIGISEDRYIGAITPYYHGYIHWPLKTD